MNSVQNTNDDACISKALSVQLGYYKDPYVSLFQNCCHNSLAGNSKRPPIINRGYYGRVILVENAVKDFIKIINPSSGSSVKNWQILNLGAGYDTLYWRLCDKKMEPTMFVELDFGDVVSSKIMCIKNSKKLSNNIIQQHYQNDNDNDNIITSKVEKNYKDSKLLKTKKYYIVEADLNKPEETLNLLKSSGMVDFSIPTLVISECVMVYLDPSSCDKLMDLIATNFEEFGWVLYDPINPYDSFGFQMVENIQKFFPIPGIFKFPSLKDYETKFSKYKKDGYQHEEFYKTMKTAFDEGIPSNELIRINKIEMLDEYEEWNLLMNHYCFVKFFRFYLI